MNEKVKIGAVILAAGLSQRMGRQKLVLPWGKRTVIEQVIESLYNGGAEAITVVSGKSHDLLTGRLSGSGVQLVFNPDYANGSMLTSLKVGLNALEQTSAEAALLALGDQPQIQAQTVQAVISAYRVQPAKIIVPSWQMRRGHPWAIPAVFWEEILSSGAEYTMRDFLKSHEMDIEYVLVDTPTIIADLDTPEDYEREKPRWS